MTVHGRALHARGPALGLADAREAATSRHGATGGGPPLPAEVLTRTGAQPSADAAARPGLIVKGKPGLAGVGLALDAFGPRRGNVL